MLPRNEKLVRQLCSLERTVTRGSGKDVIDHPRDRGMHDDVANSVAGVAVPGLPKGDILRDSSG